jgi:predicted nucleotidyltransferase
MTRAEIITRLAAREAELRERFGLERLGLFGSAARDELGTD